ncbi:phage tail protein [Albidovulum aquaemixtae]|uniref:phage tail protein n=1 Tax=Albidovulum aquaemixtae TaxID=1542388 RepID=UPI0015E7EF50|nr:hypothetical protein [Defluviimonas aquaemixtae]
MPARPAEHAIEGQTAARAATAITGAVVEGIADLAQSTGTATEEAEAAPQSSETPSGPVEGEAASAAVEAVALDTEGGAAAPSRETAAPGEATEAEPPAEAPEEPAEPSPAQAVAPAARAVSSRAAASAAHQPESAATGAAMASSDAPEVTGRRSAAALGAAQADEAETGEVDRQTFRQQLREAIDNAMPPPESEDDAKRLMDEGGEDAAREIQGSLGGHTAEATGGLPAAVEEANQPAPTPEGEAVPLEPEAVGDAPAAVSAGPVVPPPSTPQAVDMSRNRAETDALAAENNITDTMLERGNDPQFTATLGARGEAERHNEEGPAQLREAEAADRAATHGRAAGVIASGLTDFHATRATQLNEVAGQQAQTSGLTAARKAEITATIEGIGQRTRTDVTDILTKMTEKVGEKFQTAIDEALADYNDAFDDVRGGLLTRFGEFFTGGGDARFKRALAAGRLAFKARIDRAIDEVATFVEAELARARARVQAGRDEIDTYINETLPENERDFAGEASQSITEDFEALEGEISSSRDAIISNMVDMYREGIQRRNAREEELRLANRSLWERVYDATVGVVQKVLEFKNMLLGILARAASVVTAIIEDPIQFLTNLIAGIKAGLDKFMGNIVENLKQALMGWLFGALEGAGLQLPETWDLKGFLSVVLQVLGLTKENVRARAVRILGEDMVAKIETGVEIIRVLFTEGPAGLWQMLLEKLGDIKETILAEIRSWVITKIVEAGIKWLIGLLNPAGAFVKACMMIYDIVVFFIERGQQIIAAVNAIINSLAVIVAGNIGAMATAVEGALNRILPVVIGFLASLLGLGGISDKIRQFMEAVQRPVNMAIDWIINKGVALARGIKGLFGAGREEEPQEEEAADPEVQAQIDAGLLALRERNEAALDQGEISQEEAEAVAAGVRRDYPVFKSIEVESAGGRIKYEWSANPTGEVPAGEDEGTFTSDQVVKAKLNAVDEVMDDYGLRQALAGRTEEMQRIIHVPEGEDVSRIHTPSRQDMLALGNTMSDQIEASGSEGITASRRPVDVGPEGVGGVTISAGRFGPERPNVPVHGAGSAPPAYTEVETAIASAATHLGMTRGALSQAYQFWRRNYRLPAPYHGTAHGAEIEQQLRVLETIRLVAERTRGRSAIASSAAGEFIMHERASRRPDAPVTPSALAPIASEQPEAGEQGGAQAFRMGEDAAMEVPPRDRISVNPTSPAGQERKEALLRAIEHFRRMNVAQAEALIQSERFRGIETEEELKDGFVEVIIDYATGGSYG